MTHEEFLERLIKMGGAIVSSGDADAIEITNAQATGRFFVNDEGFGFIHRLERWRVYAEKSITQCRLSGTLPDHPTDWKP